ncbi:MAG: hypothetical protein WAL90_15670 [Desulfobacterales bacterium]
MGLEKKKAAAIAAVMSYIESEEEMVAAQAMAGRGAGQPVSGPVAINLWGLNGRQTMMQLRSLMQLRSFHGGRFR